MTDKRIDIKGVTSVGAAKKIAENIIDGKVNPIMREFDSGAKRDTDAGKVNYIRGLSTLVLKCYGQYMLKHNSQRDGEKRREDNWKKGFSLQSYLESKARHFIEGTWDTFACAINDEDEFPENEVLENQILDALNAELFNTMGFMHTILQQRLLKEKKKDIYPVCGGEGHCERYDRGAPFDGPCPACNGTGKRKQKAEDKNNNCG